MGTVRAAPAALVAMLMVPALATSGGSRTGRPFDHRVHARISCRQCHGTGALHRTILVRSARDCASCHHDPERGRACGDCHDAGGPQGQRLVTALLRFTVWDSARTRELPFRHEVHAPLACRDCHGAPVTLEPNRECASCHEKHHRPDATCSTCHQPPRPGVHNAAAHLSCTGTGCHAATVAPAPASSRTLCLVCHTELGNHQPGRDCAVCHRIPATGSGLDQKPAETGEQRGRR
jgi:hypothetical protein